MNMMTEEEKKLWNTIHGKEWKRTALLGAGNYGSVFIGQRVEDGMVFAVKSTELVQSKRLQVLQNELTILSQLRCKYIVRMLGWGRSDGSNSFLDQACGNPMLDLFLEYIPRGSLNHLMRRMGLGTTSAISDLNPADPTEQLGTGTMNELKLHSRIKRLPEAFVRAYAADILRAVDYLHRKQLVHGDIKPANLLVAEDCLKLADFGGCKTLKRYRAQCLQISTRQYIAPEVHYKVEQGLASDIFSVGCTLLEMTAGSVPDPIFVPQWLSTDAQNFLRRCLTSDPRKRWSAGQLLEHPFIRDRDQNNARPYTTIIPTYAERMILQPPRDIEGYTNSIFSPTYRGPGRWRICPKNPPPLFSGCTCCKDRDSAVADSQKLHHIVYDNEDSYRKEMITISGSQSQPTVASSSSRHHDQQPDASDPKNLDAMDRDPIWIQGNNEPRVAVLPAYKPEFVPPLDQSLHFLLPAGPGPARDETEREHLDSGRPMEASKGRSAGRGPITKPPPLVIPGTQPEVEMDSYSQRGPSSPATKKSKQKIMNLDTTLYLPIAQMEGYNQKIRGEARLAEVAGLYDNKLCPDVNDNDLKMVSDANDNNCGMMSALDCRITDNNNVYIPFRSGVNK